MKQMKLFAAAVVVCAGVVFASEFCARACAGDAETAIPEQSAKTIAGVPEMAGAFKNGVAVVRERFDFPAPGTYLAEMKSIPLYGSFFVQCEKPLELTTDMRDISVPVSEVDDFSWTKDLAGKSLRAVLPNRENERTFRVLPNVGQADPESVVRNPYAVSSVGRAGTSNGLCLECENGEIVWIANPSQILAVSLVDGKLPETVLRRRPCFEFTLSGDAAEYPASACVTYLTRGISWTPQYRVNLLDAKNLEIEQSAVLVNEERDLTDAEIMLYTGFPQLAFEDTNSPLFPSLGLSDLFQNLNARRAGGFGGGMQTQMTLNSAFMFRDESGSNGTVSLNNEEFSDGVDLFIQQLGKKSLKKGARSLVEIGKGKAEYNKYVCWNIRDARDNNGRVNYNANTAVRGETPANHYGQTTSGEAEYAAPAAFPEPWDVVEFKNPFAFPITTGPVVAMNGDDRFLAQNMLFWTGSGAKTVMPLTKALSVSVRSTEKQRIFDNVDSTPVNMVNNWDFEIQKAVSEYWGRVLMLRRGQFRVEVVDARIEAVNTRGEDVDLRISRQFSGILIDDSVSGLDGRELIRISGSGSGNINPRNELQWTVHLKPGEEYVGKFSYQVLIML